MLDFHHVAGFPKLHHICCDSCHKMMLESLNTSFTAEK